MKKLNFGCGADIREGWDNVDVQKIKGLTKSFNFNKFPYPLKNNYYDYVLISLVLENMENPVEVLEELRKKCKNKAIIEIITPYWNNKGLWNDLYTKRAFTEDFFRLLSNKTNEYFLYGKEIFNILEINLIPTNIGKFIPKFIRERLCLFISGIIMHLNIKLEVIK